MAGTVPDVQSQSKSIIEPEPLAQGGYYRSNHGSMSMTGNDRKYAGLLLALRPVLPNTELPCVVRSGNGQTATPQHLKPLVFFKGIDERYALLNTAAHK
jgi:hypothetical protein